MGNTGLHYNRESNTVWCVVCGVWLYDARGSPEEVPVNVGVEDRVQEGFLKEVTPEVSPKH